MSRKDHSCEDRYGDLTWLVSFKCRTPSRKKRSVTTSTDPIYMGCLLIEEHLWRYTHATLIDTCYVDRHILSSSRLRALRTLWFCLGVAHLTRSGRSCSWALSSLPGIGSTLGDERRYHLVRHLHSKTRKRLCTAFSLFKEESAKKNRWNLKREPELCLD